ncbi:MAG: LysR family transcriptional regulator [Puniceicoccaceae bacterium MED-G30]|jgi:DNA-binding transcriptional LysR family regulator|nr:MAG: LysR family transcriptional regulator [Puniceicoccaceae bacterium MED-G30]RPG83858.1 MAG: LysR family transcriptional regulator [Coraliomargarita sp. TMED73]RPG87221.1 MAG: LysR family transcriptional regulator [Coraliomargarita sp. TMED73]|tara:strand:+ start:2877 stop:3785 length:909 start_codon:yes stop_codon:yes gene_type:complete
MHVENFKTFSDLVESESFSRAAKLNGITQSAVSQQLRAMEKHFGILIVDRRQKQFRLTPEGQRLQQAAHQILHLYDGLNSELQEMKRVVSGTLHISTVYSIGLHELPPYLKAFMTEYPEVNVRVEYRRADKVYEDVLSNSIDFGLVAYPQKQRELEILPFHTDTLVLVVNPEHPLATVKQVALEELKSQKFIGFEPDIPTRRATDEIFAEAGIEIEPVMEFDNVETVKRAVEINAGIAIIPQATVTREASQGHLKIIPIENGTYTRPLALILRKGRIQTPAMKKIVEILTEKNLNKEATRTD